MVKFCLQYVEKMWKRNGVGERDDGGYEPVKKIEEFPCRRAKREERRGLKRGHQAISQPF